VPRFQIARLTLLTGHTNEVSSTQARACIRITHKSVTFGFLSGVRIDLHVGLCELRVYYANLFVYFRINNDFSFDDAAAAHFKCTVRSFDPRSE